MSAYKTIGTDEPKDNGASESASTPSPADRAATNQPANNNSICKLGNYKKRCLERLLAGRCEREPLDRYIGTSNSPEYIRQLINKHGLHIKTHRKDGFNRDGRPTWWGEYELLKCSFAKARLLLGVE